MIGLLISNWRWVACGLILVTCAITVGVTKYQLNQAKAELAEMKANYVLLSQAAKECSDSVELLEEAEKRASRNAQDALKALKAYRDTKKQSAAAVANSKAISGDSDYEATQKLFNSAIRDRLH